MMKNYFKIAFRNLTKYKVYSFINLLGLSIALVLVMLILLYVLYEVSYDRYNENFDGIYRVVRKNSAIMPMPLAAALKTDVPEIEYAARMRTFSNIVSYKEKRNIESNLLYADPDILNIFTFDFLYGNSSTVLSDKYSILLSESTAKKYFGNEYPIGKVIEVNDVYYLKVTGVFKDLPDNSHFSANFIIPASIIAGDVNTVLGTESNDLSWGSSMFFTYVLLKENSSPEVFLSKIHGIIEKYAGEGFYTETEYSAQPLSDIHLFSNYKTELKINGDITKIYIYASLAFIMLVIALINYVNLATARASRRVKEIGVRKIIGAKKQQLIKQLLSETLLLTFFAFALAFILTKMVLPYFNEFVDINIELNFLQSPVFLFTAFGLIVLIGLAAGIYPSFVLSSINPLSVFSGKSLLSDNTRFRSILVVIQFMLSIILIFITTVVNKQMDYIATKELGFTKENIIYLDLQNYFTLDRIEAFKNEISQNPGITAVTASINLPFSSSCSGGLHWQGEPEHDRIEMNYNMVDYDYIDFYGLKIIEGRKFLRDHPSDVDKAVIISEKAVEEIGWKEPLGKVIQHSTPNGTENRTVIGIVKDFHMHSFHKQITPYYLVIDKRNEIYNLSIKLNPQNLKTTIDYLKDKIKSFDPDNPFNYFFVDDFIRSSYNTEFKTQTVFSSFSGFTIFIACLGLFGLVSFTTEVRKKEIGIRKVMGAATYQIIGKILKEMMILIIISILFAVPIAYYTMNKWLQDFAYRIEISWWMFVLSGGIALMIALVTVSFQAIKAARAEPIDALRYE